MKIAIASVQIPFITGGAEILAELLKNELIKRKHRAEIVTIPFKWYPTKTLINSMLMGRMMDLTEVNGEVIDLVIGLKFPAYYVRHPNKALWLLHQHRQAYDLWDTDFGDLHTLPDGEFLRNTIIKNDNEFIKEARRIFTISKNTTARLKKYNNIDSIPLYHPPKNHEKLHCKEYEDFIFYPSRIDKLKRQRLLVSAAKFLETNVKIYIAGGGSQSEIEYLKEYIRQNSLEERVKLLGFISEEEKIDLYSRCLAVYFGAYDEDYGYITLEAFFSAKPCIVHADAGGPLEFITDNENSYVVEENPEMLAKKIDFLLKNKEEARRAGKAALKSISDMNINWDHVINSMLGDYI